MEELKQESVEECVSLSLFFIMYSLRTLRTDTLLRTVTFFQVVSPLLASALAEHGDHVSKIPSFHLGLFRASPCVYSEVLNKIREGKIEQCLLQD